MKQDVSAGMSFVSREGLVVRLRKRAEIRRQIQSRRSVQEGKPDRLSDLLEEAANEIERLQQPSFWSKVRAWFK